MQAKHVLIVSAGALFAMGGWLILLPAEAAAGLNININYTIIQTVGLVFIGFGLINWLSRNKEELSLKPIISANLIFYFFGFLFTMIHYLSGVGNEMAWFLSALFLLMTIAFGFAICCIEMWEHLTGKLQ